MPSHVFARVGGRALPVADHAEGVFIWDRDGKRYLDGSSGAMVVNIGHGNREVVAAMAAQAGRVAFAHGSHFTSEAHERLADRIAEQAPGDLDHVYLVSGGSEATETAIKLATQYHRFRGKPGKTRVIGRWHSYHGNTLGALSASGHMPRRAPHAAQLLDFPHIVPPYCYRCPLGLRYPSCAVACANELETAIQAAGADTVAAFIAEPVIGSAAGAVPAPQEYFGIIREICDRHDVLFIADEVMTGVGRTGRMWGVEHHGVVPDLLIAGKGLGSGYTPLAGVVARRHVHAAFGGSPFIHGFTYAGNPVSCAVGLAVQDVVQREGLVERAAQMGELLRQGLEELAGAHPVIGDVRGRGLLRAIELVADRDTREPFPRQAAAGERLAELAMEEGLIVYPGAGHADGVRGDHVMVAPPLIVTQDQVDLLVNLLDRSLSRLEKEPAASL